MTCLMYFNAFSVSKNMAGERESGSNYHIGGARLRLDIHVLAQ